MLCLNFSLPWAPFTPGRSGWQFLSVARGVVIRVRADGTIFHSSRCDAQDAVSSGEGGLVAGLEADRGEPRIEGASLVFEEFDIGDESGLAAIPCAGDDGFGAAGGCPRVVALFARAMVRDEGGFDLLDGVEGRVAVFGGDEFRAGGRDAAGGAALGVPERNL